MVGVLSQTRLWALGNNGAGGLNPHARSETIAD